MSLRRFDPQHQNGRLFRNRMRANRQASGRHSAAFSLAARTIESSPLALDNPSHTSLKTDFTGLAFAIVNAMMVLITSLSIECIAIRPIAESGPLIAYRSTQNRLCCKGQPIPVVSPQPLAGCLRMDPGGVQDFSRIEITDAGNGPLIEQGDFDFASALAKLFLKLGCGNGKCVGSKFFRTQFYGKLFGCEKLHRTQAAAIPEEEFLRAFPLLAALSEVQAETQMLCVGRIGQQ